MGDVMTDHNTVIIARLVAAPDFGLALSAIAFVRHYLRRVHWCIQLRMHRRAGTWGACDIAVD